MSFLFLLLDFYCDYCKIYHVYLRVVYSIYWGKMLKVIIVSENSNLIESFRVATSDISLASFYIYEDCEEAINFINNNRPDIGIFSLDLSIMNGDELAEIMINNNSEAKFCFIYNQNNIPLALSLFNQFNYTRLILDKIISYEELKKDIELIINEFNKENSLNKELERLKMREQISKDKMEEMSQVLNSRIECYNSLNKAYVNAVRYLIINVLDTKIDIITDFLGYIFAQYLHDYLIEMPVFEEVIGNLTDNLNQKDLQRHYQFNSYINASNINEIERICFSSFFLSHLFADFLTKYRMKIELKENDTVVRLDFLCDIRLGQLAEDLMIKLKEVVRSIANTLCDKIEFANKDGIIQYRMFFIKNN